MHASKSWIAQDGRLCRGSAVITAIAMWLAAAVVAHATGYTWVGGSGTGWMTPANWVQKSSYPGAVYGDTAAFTNNADYTVSLGGGSITNLKSCFFGSRSGTVTFDIGTSGVLAVTNDNDSFQVGSANGSTASVAIVSGTLLAHSAATYARVWIGNSGAGSLTLTNARIAADTLYVGLTSSRGSLGVQAGGVIDMQRNLYGGGAGMFSIGQSASTGQQAVVDGGVVTNVDILSVGNSSGAFGDSLIVTNSGKVWQYSAADCIVGGLGSTSNRLVIAGGSGGTSCVTLGGAVSGGKVYIGGSGSGGGAVGNALVADGAGLFGSAVLASASTNSLTVYVGYYTNAVGNSLLVTNGAVLSLTNSELDVGYCNFAGTGASSNAISFGGGSILCSGKVATVNVGYQKSTTVGGGFNTLVVTNAILVSKTLTLGICSPSNSVIVQRDAVWDFQNLSGSIVVGSGTTNAVGNVLTVDGGVLTNVNWLTVGGYQKVNVGNRLVLTNGARLYAPTGGAYMCGRADDGGTAISNSMEITGTSTLMNLGGGSLATCYANYGSGTGNVIRVSDGATVTNVGQMMSGEYRSSIGNQIIISNAQVFATTTVHAGFYGNTNFNNTILVTGGGLLEVNDLRVNNGASGPVGGNTIVNAGGIYQFTTKSPLFTIISNDTISISNGTISFRAINNANVNVGGTSLTNLTWSGTNGFRLDNATNNVASPSQDYVFTASRGATNYARLELRNGARFAGSVTIAGDGSMFVSNGGCSVSNLTLQSGATLRVALSTNGVAPLLVERTLALGGSTLAVTLSAVPVAGTIYPVISNVLAQASLGTFTNAQVVATLGGTNYQMVVQTTAVAGGGVNLMYRGLISNGTVLLFR